METQRRAKRGLWTGPMIVGVVLIASLSATQTAKAGGGECGGAPNGTPCATGVDNPCRSPSFCFNGICFAGAPNPNGTLCGADDDGNPCTGPSACNDGVCILNPPTSGGFSCGNDDDNPCRNPSVCSLGVCYKGPSKPNGTVCGTDEDGNPCTGPAACFDGTCVPNPPTSGGFACGNDDDNPCRSPSVCYLGVCYAGPPKPTGTPCDTDGNPCTHGACDGDGTCDQEAMTDIDEEQPKIGDVAPLARCYESLDQAVDLAIDEVTAAATDNCKVDHISVSELPVDPMCYVPFEVVAVDTSGNESDPVQFSTLIDNTRPRNTCTQPSEPIELEANCRAEFDLTVVLDDDCCLDQTTYVSSIVRVGGQGHITTACEIPIVHPGEKRHSVSCHVTVDEVTECPLVIRLSLTGKDCCGHEIAEPCVARAEVIDTIKPVITCPEPITLERGDEICNDDVRKWLDSASATDNCNMGRVYESPTLNLSIPDRDLTGIENKITIPDSFIVEDVNVDLTISHPWVGDLMVILYHDGLPAGRTLISRPNPNGVAFGCDADNYQGIILDDEATLPIQGQCTNNLTSAPNYAPIYPLNFFDGVDAAGDWTIRVIDPQATQVGTLTKWSLHFNSENGVPITTDAPDCGFPAGQTTTVTFTAEDDCGNKSSCTSDITIQPLRRGAGDQKGSLLVFSKIEIKWDADGKLIQDTLLDVSNDADLDGVEIQAYFINGDRQLDEETNDAGDVIQEFEPGWNTADCRFHMTKNQPHFWSAAKGSSKCQPFSVLDDNGRLDSEATDGTRLLRGFVIMWAVKFIDPNLTDQSIAGESGDGIWQEIRWNHLKGDAVIVNYKLGSAWEYNAWAYQARCGETGQPLLDCANRDDAGTCCLARVVPGRLDLDGFEYDINFDQLLMDFYASGSTGLSSTNTTVMVDTDLTLHSMDIDVRQDGDGPILTKAEFEIFNENESKFSGTRRCICCWDQTLLSNYVRDASVPNHFLRTQLRTDKGYARIDGVHSDECDYYDTCGIDPRRTLGVVAGGNYGFSQDTALAGLSFKILTFTGSSTNIEWAGGNLHGSGEQSSTIRFDVGPFCGDGKVNQDREECDDRNSDECDGCTSDCTRKLCDACAGQPPCVINAECVSQFECVNGCCRECLGRVCDFDSDCDSGFECFNGCCRPTD